MNKRIIEHLKSQIQKAHLISNPYPHFYIEKIFPDDFYQELLENLPSLSSYRSLSETGKVSKGSFKERFVFPLKDPELQRLPSPQETFWHSFSEIFHSNQWISLLLDKFEGPIKERFGFLADSIRYSPVAELIKDETNYAIGPHTDLPHRVCTLLFYFPRTANQPHLGTSIYRPRDPTWTCEGNGHYLFDDFIKEKTLPFLPNSLFGFLKSDRSFHGVEPIEEENVERNLMNYYLKWTV